MFRVVIDRKFEDEFGVGFGVSRILILEMEFKSADNTTLLVTRKMDCKP